VKSFLLSEELTARCRNVALIGTHFTYLVKGVRPYSSRRLRRTWRWCIFDRFLDSEVLGDEGEILETLDDEKSDGGYVDYVLVMSYKYRGVLLHKFCVGCNVVTTKCWMLSLFQLWSALSGRCHGSPDKHWWLWERHVLSIVSVRCHSRVQMVLMYSWYALVELIELVLVKPMKLL
jgi:hypothetical protein